MTEIRACVEDRCNRLGWTFKDAATFVGISDRTLRKKCNAPDTFTVLELKRLAQMLTAAQMAEVLKGVGL